MTTSAIGQKVWNYCNVLRDAGLSYGDYLEQITFLIFLKMMDERSRPPYSDLPGYTPAAIPEGFDWSSLVGLDGEALECWKESADRVEGEQVEGGKLAGLRDWGSKHAGRVARIAGLLHLVGDHGGKDPFDTAISRGTVEQAWQIGEYLEAHALVTFDLMVLEPSVALAKRILEWIRRNRHTHFSLRDLHQHLRDVGRPSDLLPGLRVLEERDFIRREPGPARSGPGRRPSPKYVVNPHTLAHNSQNSQKAEDAVGHNRVG